MGIKVQAFEAFGLRWASPVTVAAAYGWVTSSAWYPNEWAEDGKAIVVKQWAQTIDGIKAPKTADVAAVAAAVGEGLLMMIPGGALIAAGLVAPIAMGITALKAVDAVTEALLPKDAMFYPEHWWIPTWPLIVASAGRFVCLSGTVPEEAELQMAVCVCDWKNIAEVSGVGRNWAIWLAAPDAWALWANHVVMAEKARRRI